MLVPMLATQLMVAKQTKLEDCLLLPHQIQVLQDPPPIHLIQSHDF